MKQNISRTLTRLRNTFMSFTLGQRLVVAVGGAALLLAGVMVFRWAATPDYAPLYSNLASSDASAVIDELNSEGVAYKLSNGGNTIMVPRDQVYSARIALSGKGLPGSSDTGYSILDNQGISTSQFQEQTDFKRAMEGELSNTIEAIDGVQAAVVHLALPPTKVFADQQDPPTASVLVSTAPGATLGPEQVQAIVNLVASSIDGMKADAVTVADSTGRVLSTGDGTSGGLGTGARDQEVADYQNQIKAQIQSTLDRVVGPGNYTVQVTADLDFDKAVSDSTTYNRKPSKAPLSSSTSKETYAGPAGASIGGVVGPDGQMGPTTTTSGKGSKYVKEATTEDNALGKVIEHRETAPGNLISQHIGIMLDSATTSGVNTQVLQNQISSAVGIDPKRGDSIAVSQVPFDRTADKAAQAELAQAAAAAKKAQTVRILRNAGIALAILAILLLAWIRGRRREKQRAAATTYLAEQIRQDSIDRASARTQAIENNAAVAALAQAETTETERTRQELAALVEKQPEHVAALLRGWLTERL